MSTSHQEQKLMDYSPLVLIMGMGADGKLSSTLVCDKAGYERELAGYAKFRIFKLEELVGTDQKIYTDSIP